MRIGKSRNGKPEAEMEDGKMGRWEDGKMGGWEDGRMGGWEDGSHSRFLRSTSPRLDRHDLGKAPAYEFCKDPQNRLGPTEMGGWEGSGIRGQRSEVRN